MLKRTFPTTADSAAFRAGSAGRQWPQWGFYRHGPQRRGRPARIGQRQPSHHCPRRACFPDARRAVTHAFAAGHGLGAGPGHDERAPFPVHVSRGCGAGYAGVQGLAQRAEQTTTLPAARTSKGHALSDLQHAARARAQVSRGGLYGAAAPDQRQDARDPGGLDGGGGQRVRIFARDHLPLRYAGGPLAGEFTHARVHSSFSLTNPTPLKSCFIFA